jgi:toxin ParE1/3/4
MCDDAHRQFVLRHFPYSIIYRVDDGTVIVVAVAQASRDPDYWRGRT